MNQFDNRNEAYNEHLKEILKESLKKFATIIVDKFSESELKSLLWDIGLLNYYENYTNSDDIYKSRLETVLQNFINDQTVSKYRNRFVNIINMSNRLTPEDLLKLQEFSSVANQINGKVIFETKKAPSVEIDSFTKEIKDKDLNYLTSTIINRLNRPELNFAFTDFITSVNNKEITPFEHFPDNNLQIKLALYVAYLSESYLNQTINDRHILILIKCLKKQNYSIEDDLFAKLIIYITKDTNVTSENVKDFFDQNGLGNYNNRQNSQINYQPQPQPLQKQPIEQPNSQNFQQEKPKDRLTWVKLREDLMADRDFNLTGLRLLTERLHKERYTTNDVIIYVNTDGPLSSSILSLIQLLENRIDSERVYEVWLNIKKDLKNNPKIQQPSSNEELLVKEDKNTLIAEITAITTKIQIRDFISKKFGADKTKLDYFAKAIYEGAKGRTLTENELRVDLFSKLTDKNFISRLLEVLDFFQRRGMENIEIYKNVLIRMVELDKI